MNRGIKRNCEITGITKSGRRLGREEGSDVREGCGGINLGLNLGKISVFLAVLKW